jgi:hypothetical protein
VPRGPTEWAITWPPLAVCTQFVSRRERLLPPPGKTISMDILRGCHTPLVLASLLAAMPLGVVRPDALPRHGRARILGNSAFYVGGEDWPILTDVEIGEFLELPEGPLPDEVRMRLDRIEEGTLTLFRRAAPALYPLARMGDAVRADLIQALLAHLDPARVRDQPYPDDKRPAGFYRGVYAAVGRAVANPTTGHAYPVGRPLRYHGSNRHSALVAAVGSEDANTPGLFPLDPPSVLAQAATDGTLAPFLDNEEDDTPLNASEMTALAHSVDALRALVGAQMEEFSTLRQEAIGGVTLLSDRLGRLEFRAPANGDRAAGHRR